MPAAEDGAVGLERGGAGLERGAAGLDPGAADLERGAPFFALYEHWERHQWSPFDLDFSVDRESFARLDEPGRQALLWLFGHRYHGEAGVARLLAPFLLSAPDDAMQLLIATQVADEHRHVQAVVRVYQQVFGVEGGLKAVEREADRRRDPVERELSRELEETVMPLVDGFHEERYARAVFAYHVIAEGVMARASQNLSTAQFQSLGEFPGLAAGQRRVTLDESRHIGIGLTYLRRALLRSPEIVRHTLAEAVSDWKQIATRALAQAQDGNGVVMAGYGVDPVGFVTEAMRLLGMRMRALGLAELL
jgi:ribonucleotide reductase beta subunit family protein with ferritin-like domain